MRGGHVECVRLRKGEGTPSALAQMTFPAYRHLLALDPAPRHPGQGDRRLVQPLAIAAFGADAPVGLVLAEMGLGAGCVPEMLSLYVAAEWRNHGIGTTLVSALEQALVDEGCRRVTAVYTTGKPGIAALERVLEKRRWSPPSTRTVVVRFTPEEAARTDWFGRFALPASDFEIVPWSTLTAEARAAIRRSHEERPWIARGLEPWRHDSYGFDPVSSLGLRYRGEVVGWVINHRLEPDVVRFTCSFVRGDLSRRGRILPLYTESIRRLAKTGCRWCTFVTPVEYKEMIEFIHRRCARYVSFVGETRGSTKVLEPAAPGRAVKGGP